MLQIKHLLLLAPTSALPLLSRPKSRAVTLVSEVRLHLFYPLRNMSMYIVSTSSEPHSQLYVHTDCCLFLIQTALHCILSLMLFILNKKILLVSWIMSPVFIAAHSFQQENNKSREILITKPKAKHTKDIFQLNGITLHNQLHNDNRHRDVCLRWRLMTKFGGADF